MRDESLKAVIIDDEEPAREILHQMIKSYCPEITIVGLAGSASSARELLLENEVDALFLDVAMPIENGFEFLQSIDSSNYLFVFVTAYDHYVIQALRASAVDYLQKPVDIDELKLAVERLWQKHDLTSKFASPDEGHAMSTLLQNTLDNRTGVQRLCLPSMSGFNVIDVKDVLYLEADNNYTIFHLTDHKKIVVSKSLKEFEEVLGPLEFCRVHKSSMINLGYLKGYSREDGFHAILNNDISIPISRRRLPGFLQAVEIYNK